MTKPLRRSRCSTLLASGLLFVLLTVPMALTWRQYRLNRQLIEALTRNDTKQALTLVKAGADPNTRQEPTPAPHFLLLNGRLYFVRQIDNQSPTVLMMACGTGWYDEQHHFRIVAPLDPKLTQALLSHGANIEAECYRDTYAEGNTALLAATESGNKEIIKQVLDYGGNPDQLDREGDSAMSIAEKSHHPDIVALLRKYRK